MDINNCPCCEIYFYIIQAICTILILGVSFQYLSKAKSNSKSRTLNMLVYFIYVVNILLICGVIILAVSEDARGFIFSKIFELISDPHKLDPERCNLFKELKGIKF